MRARWSRHDGADCIHIEGAGIQSAAVVVRAATERVLPASPGMSGRCVQVDGGVCFIPRFVFLAGTMYRVEVDGEVVAEIPRPETPGPPVTEVVGIWPTAFVVPRNLLRFYVQFSSPMSEGWASRHVSLIGEDGSRLEHTFFAPEQELWDADRRRLTALVDPARIKQGLVPHNQLGYPLVRGQEFRLVVGAGFQDASGRPLRAGGERVYRVGPDVRERVDPAGWDVRVPGKGTAAALRVGFDRSLDFALLGRCLNVEDAGRRQVSRCRRVAGRVEIGREERSWLFWPAGAWRAGPYRLVVDPVLEDVAGNSVRRVFDRDISRPGHEPAGPGRVELAFEIG